MSSIDVLTIRENGKFTLPDDIAERYNFKKETDFRIVETQSGILLIPLTDDPMSLELKSEIAEWQSFGEGSWNLFEYEESAS